MSFPARTLLPVEDRIRVASLPGLGGGNVWRTAREHSAAPDRPALIADRPLRDVDGESRAEFSLVGLDELAESWAAWYLDRGVGPRDRVVVYLDDSFADQLHLAALARIGAIAVLINGRMPVEPALSLIRRTDPVGVFTDDEHRALLAGREQAVASVRWTCTEADAGVLGRHTLPAGAVHRHGPDDPILICHSSGTTGNPKPVIHAHAQSVAGIRHRLSTFPEPADSVMLSAAPQSHAGATAFTFYALLAGLPLIAFSDTSGPGVARGARQYRPTTVLAFNQTHAAVATMKPDPADFESVRLWVNMGDAAHDKHIRTLIAMGNRMVDGERVPGSTFGDGLGSSELGWAALRRRIDADTPVRPRHLGEAEPPAEVVVLREDGTVAAANEVGMLAVRSEAVAPGYWNDSDTNYRSRLSGYWLSGDLARRDEENHFFHVDRIVDAIHTPSGPGYSVLMEETLLLGVPGIVDCAVVAGRDGDVNVPVAVVRTTNDVTAADLLRRSNAALRDSGQPELVLLQVMTADDDIPTGATGKVLKRVLRERFADVRGFTADHVATTLNEVTVP
jgi:acyl-coenzyme A synthetase/AMP-(fatty) acid ligase